MMQQQGMRNRPSTATERIITFMLNHEANSYNYALNKILELELQLEEAAMAHNKLSEELVSLRKEIDGIKNQVKIEENKEFAP